MPEITKELEKRILVLDGAMGTVIQSHNLTEADFRGNDFKNHKTLLKGNNDLLSITQPNLIKNIHRNYIEAGCDIIETNTFSSTSIAMKDYDLQDYTYDLNFQSAKIAKEVCNEFNTNKYVAGSIGPTNKTASISPDINDPSLRSITFDELKSSYYDQICGLVEGGVDILLVETIFDTLNAKAALMAIQEYFEINGTQLPVMVSGTITDKSGRTLSGQTVKAFLISLSNFKLLSIGFNCALGADQLLPHVRNLSRYSNFAISAHPNAGLPNAFGEYDQSPEEMTSQIKKYFDENLLNIVGGCCGTSYEHIRQISLLAKKYKPRKL